MIFFRIKDHLIEACTLVSVFLILPFIAWGQSARDPAEETTIQNPLAADNLTEFLKMIVTDIIMPLGSIAVVFFIIYSGFLFVKAQGKPQAIEQAKTTFKWTVVGAAVLLGAWVIAEGIQGTICEIGSVPGLCGD